MCPGGPGPAFRARAVLRRGRVVVVLAVGDEARLVVVEFRVLNDQPAARVRAGVAEVAVLRVGVVEGRVAVGARADVEGRVGRVVRIDLREQPGAERVRGEDAVGHERLVVAFVVGRGGRQEGAPPGPECLFAAAVTAVEPELVATALAPGEEVAGAQVLDAHAFRLEHLEAVAARCMPFAVQRAEVLIGRARAALGSAGLGPVEHHAVAFHPADVKPRLLDQHSRAGVRSYSRLGGRFFVVAWADQDPVTRVGSVDRGLDGFVAAVFTFEFPDAKYLGRRRPGDREPSGAQEAQERHRPHRGAHSAHTDSRIATATHRAPF